MPISTLVLDSWLLVTMTTFQSAADDSEAKSNELTRAVDELHKLLKEAGEGETGSVRRWFVLLLLLLYIS